MTSRQKQNNRYAAAERRILRVRYPQDPAARKLCQLDEQRDRYSKAIDEVFGGMYRRGFRPGIDNENPAFLADFDLINRWQKEQERIARRVARIEKLSGKTTEQALHEKTCSTQAGAVNRINLKFTTMSHEKVKRISIIGTEVFIDSAASNVWPLEYREAKSERLTAILREKGRKAVEMEILFDYFSGMMQGGSRFPKAIEAAEKDGAITDHREQYDKCRIDPVYREQFLNTLHAYLSGRISPVPSAETQLEHATQQQLF